MNAPMAPQPPQVEDTGEPLPEFCRGTCAVTVTYGNRATFLERVVEAAFAAGVGHVIVVDNGSAPQSRASIDRMVESRGNLLTVVRLAQNSGSAGGFKAGLEAVRDLAEIEFVWLLDDDNAPSRSALVRLAHAYACLGEDKRVALLALRPDRKEYLRAATAGQPVSIIPNSFLGFHAREIPRKLGRRLRPRRDPEKNRIRFPLVSVGYAPYGGLLFHRSWLERVGLPEERLYLYGDDHEYTTRIVHSGGEIFLCTSAEIEDLDTSWHLMPTASRPWIDPQADERRIYYGLRNRVWLEKRYTTAPVVYFLNALAYLGFLLTLGLFANRRPRQVFLRLRLLCRAMNDGLHDRLGETLR